ncbi:MAG: hypothetical protein PQ975_07745 [Methanobacterium sp.]
MKINEVQVAILQKLWVHSIHLIENDGLEKELYNKSAVNELENLKLIEDDGGKIYLTPKGFEEFRKTIKRRELSEKSKKILHDAGMALTIS